MDGILRVDKRGGVTSHDVVAEARRALGQRDVGHAGTLDPMATGLLVVLLGEATKLSLHLTADRKSYEATVRFGATTDTLDADGEVTARVPEGTPPPAPEAVARALAAMVGPLAQVPPAVSAIKVGGVAMHERVRRGESVELPPRAVVLEAARVVAARDGGEARGEYGLALTCSKGFYVRALARDLAAALGTLGYLTALRRTASGGLDLAGAVPGELLGRAARGDTDARSVVLAAVEPLATAARTMRALAVTDAEARELGFGRRVATAAPDGTVLVLHGAAPVCVGAVAAGVLSVLRGLRA